MLLSLVPYRRFQAGLQQRSLNQLLPVAGFLIVSVLALLGLFWGILGLQG